MQQFQDSQTGRIYAYDDNVTVTIAGGISTVTAAITSQSTDGQGKPITVTKTVEIAAPTTLAPYTPPAPLPPSAAELAAAALGAGLTITCTSNSEINGTYSVDADAQLNVIATDLYLTKRGTFYGGAETYAWLDMSGNSHTFSLAEFDAFATAIGDYVAALKAVIEGRTVELPPAAVAIA